MQTALKATTLTFVLLLFVGCSNPVEAVVEDLVEVQVEGRTTGGSGNTGEETVILTSGYQRLLGMTHTECAIILSYEKFGRTTGGTAGNGEETVWLTGGYQRLLDLYGEATIIDTCALEVGPQFHIQSNQ